jgi:DnaJ-class molecular chaperone
MNEVKPYDPAWGHIDKNTQTRSLGPWEVDVKNEFPALFTPQKETKLKLPNSDSMEKCPDCLGQEEVPCPICSKSSKVTAYKYRGTMECSRCQGRGLLAHQDGSDSK